MLRRCALLLIGLLVFAPPTSATWSLILLDAATGEVGVAGATCLESLDLKKTLPVIVVGKGGGVAQSQIDQTGQFRAIIRDGLLAGTSPDAIVDQLKAADIFKCSKQYGIADFVSEPNVRGWHGGCVLAFKQHMNGQDGSRSYQLQGNVLAGDGVLGAAEAAILATPGGVAEKLMAGMVAAREVGGDGRCSCGEGMVQACGVPPNDGDFEKSSHIAFFIVARIGDVDGATCDGAGCAKGDYWFDLNVIGTEADPDPVDTLQAQFVASLAERVGHPDGLASLAVWDEGSAPGDGSTIRELYVSLNDKDGSAVGAPAAGVSVTHAEESAGLSEVLETLDHGDGTYTVRIRAGVGEGVDRFVVTFQDAVAAATLYPYPALELRPTLSADVATLSAGDGGAVTLDVDMGVDRADRPYLVLIGASGSVPGTSLGLVTLPLNVDALTVLGLDVVNTPAFADFAGTLSPTGTASASFTSPPGLDPVVIGQTLTLVGITTGPVDFTTLPVGVVYE